MPSARFEELSLLQNKFQIKVNHQRLKFRTMLVVAGMPPTETREHCLLSCVSRLRTLRQNGRGIHSGDNIHWPSFIVALDWQPLLNGAGLAPCNLSVHLPACLFREKQFNSLKF